MKKFLKKILNIRSNFKNWYKTVFRAKSDYHVPFYTKFIFALRGFTVNEYINYNLKENDYKNYISDYVRRKTYYINGAYKIILDDKVLFEEIFNDYVKVPINYAWINNGQIYGLHDFKIDNIIDFLNKQKISVLKWVEGHEGKGTYIIESTSNNSFLINGVESSEKEVLKIFNCYGQAILCEYINQSKFLEKLYPYATNTIRIVCAKKKDEKKFRIIKTVQRIGTNSSKPIDNLCAGGLVCDIDINTGKLNSAYAFEGDMDKRLIFFDNHPDTGAQIKGKIIPNWQDLKRDILDLTNQFPYLNFVAWDILLTDGGYCIIEGNNSSGVRLFQTIHGVKNNDELGDIYKNYNIF